MIRAAFFACGIFVALCGAATICVDRVVLTDYAGRRLRQAVDPATDAGSTALRLVYSTAVPPDSDERRDVIDPPDWSGFCLLSIGGVTVLYSLCLPGRRRTEDEEEDDD